jgi:acyl-CoA synthetase (AMP-forming)/AMP-acid ligase II
MADFNHLMLDVLKCFAKYPFLYYGDRMITYGEFDLTTNKLAHALLDLGVKRGSNIGIAEYNTPAFLEVTAAAWKVTTRAVTINFKFKEWELKHVIEDAGMTVVFFNEDIADRMINLRPELPNVKHYVIIGERRVEGMLNYSDLFKDRPSTLPDTGWEGFKSNDIVVLMYTGGTTGYPKGVIYTHDQLLSGPLEAMLCNFAAGMGDLANAPVEIFQGMQRALKIPGTARAIPWILSRDVTRRALSAAGKNAGPFFLKSSDRVICFIFSILARLMGGKVHDARLGIQQCHLRHDRRIYRRPTSLKKFRNPGNARGN